MEGSTAVKMTKNVASDSEHKPCELQGDIYGDRLMFGRGEQDKYKPAEGHANGSAKARGPCPLEKAHPRPDLVKRCVSIG